MRGLSVGWLALLLGFACGQDNKEGSSVQRGPSNNAPGADPIPDDTDDDDDGSDAPSDEGEDTGGDDPNAPITWFDDCDPDAMEQRMLDVGELRLNVACRGSGPTVVFLHGFPEFHHAWNGVMDELSTEYRLIAPDQRGYNTSDKPEAVEDYALTKLTQDILDLLPLISEEPVILVAHDWGGPVGWLVAHTPDAHLRAFVSTNGPHPIRLIDLLETDPDQQAASSYMNLFRSELAEEWMTPDYLATQMFGFLSEQDQAIYMDAWSQPGAITGGLNWYRANELDASSVEGFMAGRSETIGVPVYVMWGTDDEALLPQNAEGLESYAPDLEVELFEGVDHWIEHRIPAEIARVIREMDVRSAP